MKEQNEIIPVNIIFLEKNVQRGKKAMACASFFKPCFQKKTVLIFLMKILQFLGMFSFEFGSDQSSSFTKVSFSNEFETCRKYSMSCLEVC